MTEPGQGTTPLLGIVAWSGSGKTTLLEALLPLLTARGVRVGMLKHVHHDFDIDTPGKDSHRLRKAGATRLLIASSQRWALMVERPAANDDPLAELLAALDDGSLDLILVEGLKHAHYPKLEVHRPTLGKPPLYPDDTDIIAVACDAALPSAGDLPILDLNNPAVVADFICTRLLPTHRTHAENAS
jgi:molybdopterin-guanine dinucleotide biosynthesis protein MobB